MKKKAQTFNDGLVRIYPTVNTAQPGDAAKLTLGEVKCVLRYHTRTVGYARYYAASNANVKIKKLLRCPLVPTVHEQDIAITQDGEQYAIDLIQCPEDIEPKVMDLTLVKVVGKYGTA